MIIELENGYVKIDQDINSNDLVLDMVEVKNKRQGTGTKLVKMAMKYARDNGKRLTLCAYPQDDSIDLESLVDFFERLGFDIDEDDGEAVTMRMRW